MISMIYQNSDRLNADHIKATVDFESNNIEFQKDIKQSNAREELFLLIRVISIAIFGITFINLIS